MFEKEIKFIGDFSFNQVRSLGNTFTLDKIIATGIHPAIVQYISAELEYMIYSDRQKLLSEFRVRTYLNAECPRWIIPFRQFC